MAPHVAIAHYPEGAGHATRMMAVARALEERGAAIDLVGGGPGQQFHELNGFESRSFTRVDYVRDFQNPQGSVRGLLRVLTDSLPDSGRRLREFAKWLRSAAPDALLTDDMFAAAAAVRTRTPLYVLTHNGSGLYRNSIVRLATRALTVSQRLAARRFFYPTVWPPRPGDPPQVSRVPPIALTPPEDAADAGPEDPGVLVVPSTYSEGFDEVADRLREAGRDVTNVASPDWETVPALLPVLRRADAVVCAGYSTVMEVAVAGTPCVVLPCTNEQRGMARRLEAVDGFSVVDDRADVPDALADPPASPEFTNGVSATAERVLDDLR
jgi:UDP:flavonoid glycosyltransferase YjiC (YdhE family)